MKFRAWNINEKYWFPEGQVAIRDDGKVLTLDPECGQWAEESAPVEISYGTPSGMEGLHDQSPNPRDPKNALTLIKLAHIGALSVAYDISAMEYPMDMAVVHFLDAQGNEQQWSFVTVKGIDTDESVKTLLARFKPGSHYVRWEYLADRSAAESQLGIFPPSVPAPTSVEHPAGKDAAPGSKKSFRKYVPDLLIAIFIALPSAYSADRILQDLSCGTPSHRAGLLCSLLVCVGLILIPCISIGRRLYEDIKFRRGNKS